MNTKECIFVAGHKGMVGSAIVRALQNRGFTNIITRSHAKLDLTDQTAVKHFFSKEKIDRIVLAAAKVGGIYANSTYPAEFIYENLMIQTNIIHEARLAGIESLLFLGSSCIYPKHSQQPIQEESLLTGILEPTNEPYAIAKIAGIKMCESYNRQYETNYRSVMPTNLYGPGDNYDLNNSHVIPALIRKYHLAKLAMEGDLDNIIKDVSYYGEIPEEIAHSIGYDAKAQVLDKHIIPQVLLWGTGTPRREFLHVDDMAEACLYVMGLDQSNFIGENPSFLNIGCGKDLTILKTAELISDIIGFAGQTIYDTSKPDGTERKLLDTSRITHLGWKPRYSLQQGIKDTYHAYLSMLKG